MYASVSTHARARASDSIGGADDLRLVSTHARARASDSGHHQLACGLVSTHARARASDMLRISTTPLLFQPTPARGRVTTMSHPHTKWSFNPRPRAGE